MVKRPGVWAVWLGATLALVACGDDGPVEPNIPREDVAGTYALTELAFDPQGSLPEVDVRARLVARAKPDASLTLLEDGRLQLLFEDPDSRLLRLVEGSYRTTPTGVAVDFGGSGIQGRLLLGRQATYTVRTDGALELDGPASVARASLVALVPEWEQEQLLDPTPGELRAVFTPAS